MIAVLLSGGMDSAAALYLAAEQQGRQEVCAVFVDYGQLAVKKEREAAWAIADRVGVAWISDNVTLDAGSSITGEGGDLTGVDTVVPNRNRRLIERAARYGVEVWYAPHQGDWATYPDCRPDFVRDWRGKVVAPFLYLTKRDIRLIGDRLGVPWGLTWSCYAPVGGELPCGQCGACTERRLALEAL